MPVHNWSKVDANLFHHFHQQWSIAICNSLNAGLLPPGFSALIEQYARGLAPDVLTVERKSGRPDRSTGGLLLADPPRTKHVIQGKDQTLAARANRIVIRHQLGEVISCIEIVSPGNKSSKSAMKQFVSKAVEFLQAGVHLLVIDLFPPTPRDPFGVHRLIWEEMYGEEPYVLPADQQLVLASYMAGSYDRSPTAYVEPIGVGEILPDMPIYLDPLAYVPVPLEKTYQQSWDVCPTDFKEMVQSAK